MDGNTFSLSFSDLLDFPGSSLYKNNNSEYFLTKRSPSEGENFFDNTVINKINFKKLSIRIKFMIVIIYAIKSFSTQILPPNYLFRGIKMFVFIKFHTVRKTTILYR